MEDTLRETESILTSYQTSFLSINKATADHQRVIKPLKMLVAKISKPRPPDASSLLVLPEMLVLRLRRLMRTFIV